MYKKLLTVFQKQEEYRDFSTVEVLFDVLFHKYLGPTVVRHGLSEDDVESAKGKIIDAFCKKEHRRVLASLISELGKSRDLVAESKTEAPRKTYVTDVMRRLEEILDESDHNRQPNSTIS